ncbi:MAG: chemotaxis-specific protein-glutamate methyltransferase CheB [Proteobacteria bacterium]|nr:chemotaxis-specific protein-glutamate methyltransferase CheB [Pseudomonadota bacterium]
MIRVLIAEDSPVVQRVLVALFTKKELGIEVVGVANNGAEAVAMCRTLKPDLVTMDLFMPEMDGLEATKRIMDECPTRIVIVSSMVNANDMQTSFEAMHCGAVEVIEKPHGALSGNYDVVQKKLGQIVEQMMEASPENRFSWLEDNSQTATGGNSGRPMKRSRAMEEQVFRPSIAPEALKSVPGAYTLGDIVPVDFVPEVICIGGSTGAPAVLCDVLGHLPRSFPIPIVVAQHISKGFGRGMVQWLDSTISLDVIVAKNAGLICPGCVLVAPDDSHLEFGSKTKVKLVKPSIKDYYVPSVNHLFNSAAKVFGRQSLGIILSGMGRDGAKGLLRMRKAGGITLAQNEESSVVYGMPKEASAKGAVVLEMTPPEMIVQLLSIGKNYTALKNR